MSRKERERLTVMKGVKDEELTLVQAAELMGVCYRQGRRIRKRIVRRVTAPGRALFVG